MPRVSFSTYCERRAKLNQVWQSSRGDFLGMPPKEQWILHQYYRFAESMTSDQLRQHWREQSVKSSPIAQRAGRAYAVFELNLANKAPVVHLARSNQGRKRKLGKVRVDSIARPQPDTRKVAKTLLEIVQRKVKSSNKVL